MKKGIKKAALSIYCVALFACTTSQTVPVVQHQLYGMVAADDPRFQQDADSCGYLVRSGAYEAPTSARVASALLSVLTGNNTVAEAIDTYGAVNEFQQGLNNVAWCLEEKGWGV